MKNRQAHGVGTAGAAQSEIRAVLTLLSETPRQIARIVRGCGDQRLHRRPDADAWSAQEIVAHLRACAEVWGRSIDRMLMENHPTIRYVSPRGWIKKTNYLQLTFRDTLRAFSQERVVLVRTLSRSTATDWARGATFTATTLGRKATVLSYATRIADHEVRHLDQLRRTVGARSRLTTADS
ncbi:MAG TPA: DinB family protein [Vicinamibacterales bacterium]